MITRVRTGKDQPKRIDAREFRMAPIARAIAMTLAAGGVINAAYAQQAFSPSWFAAKGAVQQTAAQTGKLPNGMPVSSLHSPDGQRQRANEQLQRSINNLGLAAQAVAMQQRLQQQARDSARTQPGVPDGLADGGLKVDTNSLTAGWLNAKDPTQTVADGKTTVTIGQTADKAILNWETFNVGRNTTVNFDQATYDAAGNRTAQTNWAVLNKVNDPNARPSQIQGQIKADGTVMIVNRNGIVFSGSSQVNTRNLVAAAATITDTQFRDNGIYGSNISTPTFTDAAGKLIVERGALLRTSEPKSVTDGGGHVILLGAEVENAGEIVTRKGQTLLAAGDSFVIRRGMQITGVDDKGVSTGPNVFSTTRGSEVASQFNPDTVDGDGNVVRNPAGKVSNSGLIIAREGDITLTGRDVRQDGAVIATTTVNARGTVHLLSSSNDAQSHVGLGSSAMTAIVIEDGGDVSRLLGVTDAEAKATALDAQRETLIQESSTLDQQRVAAATAAGLNFDNYSALSDRRDLSRIEIVGGGAVDFEGGSLTLATGGQLAVSAGNSMAGTKDGGGIGLSPVLGSIRVESGAQLDVSGSVGTQVSMGSNNVRVNIQGFELRDSPLNRDAGKLFNKDVWVDRRDLVFVPAGTDGYESDRWYTKGGLLEVSGYLGTQGRGIGEWAAQGGVITFATDDANTQAGSTLNLAGGTLDVQTGYVNTTWLKGRDGKIYASGQAPTDVLYTGVYAGFEAEYARWGVTESFFNPLIAPQKRLENGYSVGRDAGRLEVWAPRARLEGSIDASVYNGLRQTESRPDGGVNDGYKLSQTQAALPAQLRFQTYDPTASSLNPRRERVVDVVFGLTPAEDGSPSQNLVWANLERLNEAGLGGLRSDGLGSLAIESDLTLAPGGVLDLRATAIDLDGSLVARGGTIKLDSGAGKFTLQDGQALDTRGLWTNTLLDPSIAWGIAFRDGGNISVRAGELVLEKGSRIDASSGAALLANDKTVGGNGGDVTLEATSLVADGELASYGFTRGGKLKILVDGVISIGGALFRNQGELAAGETLPFNVTLAQDTEFAMGSVLPFEYEKKTVIDGFQTGDTVPSGMYRELGVDLGGPDHFVIGADGWSLPAGLEAYYMDPETGDFYVFDSSTPIPAGQKIQIISGQVAEPYSIPTGVFEGKLSFLPGYPPIETTKHFAAGVPLTEAIELKAGFVLQKGLSLPQAIAVRESSLDITDTSTFFRQGFSTYDLTGTNGLIVHPGATEQAKRIDVAMPVYRFAGKSQADGTQQKSLAGDALSQAVEIVLPPLFAEDPVQGRLTQRAGASLSLTGGVPRLGGGLSSDGALLIGAHSQINVDPGQHVELVSNGQITVDGTISAPGGSITIVNERQRLDDQDRADGMSVWIGSSAVLDVAGRAYTARDTLGGNYGVVMDGGSVVLGSRGGKDPYFDSTGQWSADAWVIVRPGARIDASGASAVLNVSDRAGPVNREVASDGGSITLRSYNGIVVDDGVTPDGRYAPALRATAGGAGASGGTLRLELESPLYYFSDWNPPTGDMLPGRVLTLGQQYHASALADTAMPGVADEALAIGRSRFSVEQIERGGFDSLMLWGRTAIAFDGDIDLSLGRSLVLAQGGLRQTMPGGHVSLNAPHVFLDGSTTLWGRNKASTVGVAPTAMPGAALDASLSIDAALIDVRNKVDIGAHESSLRSEGDLRFLAGTDTREALPQTLLNAGDHLNLSAAQIYPASGANARIELLSSDPETPSELTIQGNGATPAQPYSVFGSLALSADVIRQGGVLRAPFGTVKLEADTVELLDGSITSVSTRGLVMPFGGTVDGEAYLVDGVKALEVNLINQLGLNSQLGVNIAAAALRVEAGALLDLSGGGELLGGAFVSGRGGSIDVLRHPLTAGNRVYAIIPGVATAPVAGGYSEVWDGDVPQIGQQITLADSVPGLPAGTYTLLPANYALLPGAWRIELGSQTGAFAGPLALRNGSWAVTGTESIANTSIRNVLGSLVTLTSGDTLRTYAQYNEQSYADFQLARAQTFGSLRPMLAGDAQTLAFSARLPNSGEIVSLKFDGRADFSTGKGGLGGSFVVMGEAAADLIITAPGSTTQSDSTRIAVSAADIEKIGAPNLWIGGRPMFKEGQPNIGITGPNPGAVASPLSRSLVVESGVRLSGSQVVLAAGGGDSDGLITLQDGSEINTLGRGNAWLDATSNLLLGDPKMGSGLAILLVSNSDVLLDAPSGEPGSLVRIDNATLYSEGTVGVYSGLGMTLTGKPRIGTRNLALSAPTFNVGTEASLAAAGTLPAGMNLTQQVLDSLFTGNSDTGVPAMERLLLTAKQSVNFFGTVDLDTRDPATGESRLDQLVIGSPAIYGYGGTDDTARIIANTLVWNGSTSDPGALSSTGLGAGRFLIDAETIVLGYPSPAKPDTTISRDRLMLGFSDVTFNAVNRITGNAKGSISVYQSGADPSTGFNPDTYVGTGGNLHLNTPLLTGAPGSVIAYHAGGALNVAAPAGSAAPATTNDVGAQLDLHGGSIHIASAVVLPSGKLTLTADGDVTLADGALLDVSGRRLHFFDVTRDTWGGDIEITSEHGNVVQQAGATIDVSAANEDAGSLSIAALDATQGRVALNGTLRGSGASGHDQGRFMLGAQRIGDSAATLSADFAALNTALTDAGFIGARGFAFKQGDLIIGNEVKAREVTVSVDGGSLTVNGQIDATGAKPGTIRLAARDDLRLSGSAELDARGTQLQVDSYGQAIEAKNRGTIELTSSQGWLRLDDGTTLDVSAPGVEYGRITLNARRADETGGDILVDASGRVNVKGAKSIAVNGFWTYSPTDADGSIVQDNTAGGVAAGALGLDQIDAQNQLFYANALANNALQARLAGLKAQGDAYHLQPGVEIASNAASNEKLTVQSDLDLSGYRYGPNADRNPSSAGYGTGEALALTVRAAGDLDIKGSITDGFARPKASPDDADANLGSDRPVWAIAPMLAAGSQSASIRLVGGADLSSADTRGLRSVHALGDVGNVTLNDPRNSNSSGNPIFSVIRTGTGDLDILAGGDVSQQSTFGVYTAGTQRNLVQGNEAFNLDRVWLTGNASYDAALNDQTTWFPDHGGDLYVNAQGDLSGQSWRSGDQTTNSYEVPFWLWRQGGEGMGQQTAWSINFGTYMPVNLVSQRTSVYGFSGFGALGGGNVTLQAGGDANLIAAVGATGRVLDGQLTQTGGGDLRLRVGGQLNSDRNAASDGSLVNLRGALDVRAGSVGTLQPNYGVRSLSNPDPRANDLYSASTVNQRGGVLLTLGDGALNLRTRGDLVVAGFQDATLMERRPPAGNLALMFDKVGHLATDPSVTGAGYSWFSLWTHQTTASLFSLGGDLMPFQWIANQQTHRSNKPSLLPPALEAVAGSGSLYLGSVGSSRSVFEMVPSTFGQLELLAMQSIHGAALGGDNGQGVIIGMSGARAGREFVPNPFNPAWILVRPDYSGSLEALQMNDLRYPGHGLASNTQTWYLPVENGAVPKPSLGYFAFAPNDTPVDALHAGDREPMRLYAVEGDITGLTLGQHQPASASIGTTADSYMAAKAAQVRAGRDIVDFGRPGTPNVIMNVNDTDVSVIEAGRDIFFANVQIAGPGTLEVTAGRNLYQGNQGNLVSLGPIIPGDTRPGADIVAQVGFGGVIPSWTALADRYLNPANQADIGSGLPLADQPGKVVHTYDEELAEWLSERFGFSGGTEDALTYFNGLPAEQQRIFLREVYYAELRAGGREYNDADGPRFGSYLRGRQVIAALFPEDDAQEADTERSGSYTAFGGSGIQTRFGGDIQMLVPTGRIVVGIPGEIPPGTSGLITQGEGDIQLYSEDSVLLGLSRIMTTFGGGILVWSAKGDINAGRGSKTTLVYTPPKREYDSLGNAKLSPQVPSTGAGIATLNPIPEVPPGDIDLIAPLGTIDAGEAGIRFSGNANFAALQIVNAENIVGQGEATGLPVVAAVNVAALTNASAAASQATAAAQDVMQRERATARQNLPSIFTVRVLGFGNERLEPEESEKPSSSKQPGASLQSGDERYDPSRPVKIVGLAERIDPKYWARLTDAERQSLRQDR